MRCVLCYDIGLTTVLTNTSPQMAHIKVRILCSTRHSDVYDIHLLLMQHMNHGPEFQRLWSQLRVEVQFLQSQGYYGDGMY
jgi:hypothetical protein